MKNHSILERARFSLRGLVAAWRRERSFRTHVLLSAAALAAALAVRPGALWLAVVVLSLAAGLAAELLNAAIEGLCDRLHPGRDPQIGAIKDMASAAAFVLNCVTACVTVAMIANRPPFVV